MKTRLASHAAALTLATLLLWGCASKPQSQRFFSPSPPSTPSAPSDLQVKWVPHPGGILDQGQAKGHFFLSWTDNSDNELGFVVERYYRQPRQVVGIWARVATVEADHDSYSHATIVRPPGVDFPGRDRVAYRVKAFNAGGASAYSNVAWDCFLPHLPGTCNSSPVAPIPIVILPATPAGLQATQGEAIGKISLFWDPVAGADAYRVHLYDPARQDFLPQEPTVPEGYTSAWGGFDAGQSYAFRVTALDASGRESEPSEIAVGWAGSGSPVETRASYGAYADRIVLDWPAVQADLNTDVQPPEPVYATEYDLYQAISDDVWQKIGGTGELTGEAQAHPSITVNGVLPNTEYAFKVVSIYPCDAPPGNQCESEYGLSPIARGCAGPQCRTLPVPVVSATDDLCSDCDTPSRVEVHWSQVNGAVGYDLHRAPSPWGPRTPLLIGAMATAFVDRNVIPWTSYQYCVQAIGAQGERSPFGCDWGGAAKLTSYYSEERGRCFPSCEHPGDLP